MANVVENLSSYGRSVFTHDTLLRWVSNPATLVTVGAPILIDTSIWKFLASSTGSYAVLARTPDVCALLEHRTQLYTMLVACAFCIFQVLLWSFFGGAAEGTEEKKRAGWRHTIAIVLGIILIWTIFSGRLMSEDVVAMYKLGACQQGVPSPMEFPPLASPITQMRIFIVFLLLFASARNGEHAPAA
jgi:hypothetical protein